MGLTVSSGFQDFQLWVTSTMTIRKTRLQVNFSRMQMNLQPLKLLTEYSSGESQQRRDYLLGRLRK